MTRWWRASVILSRALCGPRGKPLCARIHETHPLQRGYRRANEHGTSRPRRPAIARGFFTSSRTYMSTIPYYIGESGTLGFPVNEYDGSPIDPAGLGCRLTIYQDGPDLTLIGTWESGPVDNGSGPVVHPAIASFSATPETMPAHAKAYRCGLEIDDGSGWRTIGNHIIDVRRL